MKTHRYPKIFREAMKEVIDSKLSDILRSCNSQVIDEDNTNRSES